jgi:hypothetical protein
MDPRAGRPDTRKGCINELDNDPDLIRLAEILGELPADRRELFLEDMLDHKEGDDDDAQP